MKPKHNKRQRIQFRPSKLRVGHGRLRTRNRTIKLASGKTIKVKGKKPEEFVRKALMLGIGAEQILKNFTGISHYKIRLIKRDLERKGLLPEKTWRQRRIEALVLQGEMSLEKISIETKSSQGFVKKIKTKLYKKDKMPKLKGTKESVMKAIRALITYEAVRIMTGKSHAYCDRIAQKESPMFSSKRWYYTNPDIVSDAATLAFGTYWDKAMQQLLEGKSKAGLRGEKAKKALLEVHIRALKKRREIISQQREKRRQENAPARELAELMEKIRETNKKITMFEREKHSIGNRIE